MNTASMLAALALAAASFSTVCAAPPTAAVVTPASPTTSWVVTARETLAGVDGIARSSTDWVDSLGRQLVVAELDADGVLALGRHVHESEGRCAGFFGFPTREEAEGFIANGQAARAITLPMGGLYTIDNQATVDPWLLQVDHANIYDTIANLSAFRNRLYTSSYGHDAAVWIRDSWQALAGGRSDVHFELVNCASCSTQPSVIMTVDGTDLADEVVVIGGHLDSINWDWGPGDNEQVAPGADDDASGIATITEIIRIAMTSGWQPRRTVKFMGYAAEELGLYGSQAIANQYYTNGINVVGVLQLDMTNYKTTAPNDLRIMTDNANADLLVYFAELFDFYLAPRGYSRGEVDCGYGCSDHASWTDAGYPAAGVFEAGRAPSYPGDMADFPYIHTADDTLANMNDSAAPSGPFAQFGLAFLGELAKTYGTGPNQPPVAAFNFQVGHMNVRFNDASTDPDGSIVSWIWDFGDGTQSTLPNPIKNFTAVGTHAVALTVTDDGGLSDTALADVSVDNGVLALDNGVAATGLPALAGGEQDFSLEVPVDAVALRFTLSGAGGENADLVVQLNGSVACAMHGPGTQKTCSIPDPPAAGTWTATVQAVTALSGFSITGQYADHGDRIFADDFEP